MNGMVVEQHTEGLTEHEPRQEGFGDDGAMHGHVDGEEGTALRSDGEAENELHSARELLVKEIAEQTPDGQAPIEQDDPLSGVVEPVLGRRNRKRSDAVKDVAVVMAQAEELDQLEPGTSGVEHPDPLVDEGATDGTTETDGVFEDDDWQRTWPQNELRIVATLQPFVTQAPGVDGIVRMRGMVDLTEIDPLSGQSGTVASVPVQILPMAQGWGPIWHDLVGARKAKRRLEPIPVVLHGVSKRLRDQDRRYANVRWNTLFGFEISHISRVRRDEAHYGVWRGRGTVARCASYTINDEVYERVTLHVRSERHKPQLRGASVQVDEVDVLVHTEHLHADRFGRIGASLLVEAEVKGQTSVLRSTHPDLEGLDDERRDRLQVLRQGVLIVTLGEWTDEEQVSAHEQWVSDGRPQPARQRRGGQGTIARAS